VCGWLNLRAKRKRDLERLEKYPAGRPICSLLPGILKNIKDVKVEKRWQLKDVWQQIIGPKMAPYTKIQALKGGVVFVQVASPTLLNLLVLKEKPRLINELQKKLPHLNIKTIVFRR